MANNKLICCRWCEWSTAQHWENKGGQIRSGYEKLGRHIMAEHGAELLRVNPEEIREMHVNGGQR